MRSARKLPRPPAYQRSDSPGSRYLLGMDRNRRLWLSVGAGIAAAALGFGALNIFYWTGGRDRPGPGLYDYLSSSIGDAIALPVVMAALVWLNLASAAKRVDNIVAVIAFAVGALIGVLLQASWLADPSPVTNWTLPRAHTFTPAGWYHAAFLTVVIAVLLAASARVGSRLARMERQSGDWVAIVIVACASFFFDALLLIDNLSRRSSGASDATVLAIGGAIALVGGAVAGIAIRFRLSAQQLRGTEHTKRDER